MRAQLGTKTENTIREVPIPLQLAPIFEYQLETCAGEQFFFRTAHQDRPVSEANADLWARRVF